MLAHITLFALLHAHLSPSPRMGQGRAPALVARLAAPPVAGSPRPKPAALPAAALPKPEPAPRVSLSAPALQPAPEPGAEAGREAGAATQPSLLPGYYRPTSALSRGPELLTPPADDDWPILPDAPPGRFQLELAIGADGTVDRVVPLCEEALCPAAEVYAELVSRWRFQPGDLNGEPMPSRLRLEFEIGLPLDAPGEDQAPRQ